MNWDAIGAIAELFGALAVIATLIFLAHQIRQSNRSTRLMAILAQRQSRLQLHDSVRNSEYLPHILVKLESGETLTRDEEIRLDLHWASAWGQNYTEWMLNDFGGLGEYASNDVVAEFLLGNESAMQWWEESGKRIYPEVFVNYVEEKRKALNHTDSP